MARLIISEPDGKRSVMELSKPLLTIGRSAANDIVLNDTSVSRYHAAVTVSADGGVSIADRGSTNGVMVNGQRITQETALSEQDRVRLGVYELKLELPSEAAPLLIKKVEISSSIDEVLRGESGALKPSVPLEGSAAEMSTEIRRLERENFLLRLLYDAGRALNSKLSIDDIIDQVMTLAFRIEGVERGFITLYGPSGEVMKQSEVRYRRAPKADQPKIVLSRAILERLRSEMEPILVLDVAGDVRFQSSVSMKISGLRSVMVAPLIRGGWGTAGEAEEKRMFGVFYVDNLERSSAFSQEEMNVFAVIASQAAIAIENALSRDELAEQALQRSALERFLSPDVVEMIAANPQEIRLGGVNQKISVLFADIRGFTSLSEQMEPQRIVEVLNDYFTRVTDIIFDHGGTLDKYLGDGVMAVFGAPISKGNDAENAVRTAVEIQRLVETLNRDAPVRGFPQFQVGIGVNTGIATAGNIGSPKRIDYTVVGDAVNVAARLMANATGGQILITAATANDLGAAFRLTPLPPLSVKGKAEALQVSEVHWAKAEGAGAN
ncbi:MAG: adenylate/guanylate cyclase domain-containing protein [Terriglobales bacterium]